MRLVGRYRGRNHVCNISWLSIKGCGCGERGKFAFSHWLDASPLQHCLPCDRVILSAYRKFHSTETVLAKVHNDIITAIDRGDTGALTMLDLKVYSSQKNELAKTILAVYSTYTQVILDS